MEILQIKGEQYLPDFMVGPRAPCYAWSRNTSMHLLAMKNSSWPTYRTLRIKIFSNNHKNITLKVIYISGPFPGIFSYGVHSLYKTSPANTIQINRHIMQQTQ